MFTACVSNEVKEALGVVLNLPADRRVPCGVFGSFGWSGEAVDELQFRLTLGQPLHRNLVCNSCASAKK